MSRRFVLCCLSFAAFLVPSTARADEPAKTYEVKIERNLAYYEGDDADKIKHKLDMYVPKDLKRFPVLFFVHGGAWRHGDKDFFNVYSSLAKAYAKHGLGVVVTNYRLSPKVKHPEHIKDVARSFAWTCKNIGRYGGDKERIFVCGHSAGGHLVALLATDESYLKAEGVKQSAIRGAIPMSGVMSISDKLLPSVFGRDKEVCKLASPLSHVRADLPPFLVIWADSDLPLCSKTSKEFYDALKGKKCEAEGIEVKERNHVTLLLNAAAEADPVRLAIHKFIAAHKGP
jgi:acetyl esterase/lipase